MRKTDLEWKIRSEMLCSLPEKPRFCCESCDLVTETEEGGREPIHYFQMFFFFQLQRVFRVGLTCKLQLSTALRKFSPLLNFNK